MKVNKQAGGRGGCGVMQLAESAEPRSTWTAGRWVQGGENGDEFACLSLTPSDIKAF